MVASFRDPNATWLGSPNYSAGRPGGVSWIVLHTEVGTNASANARFQNIAQAASAHYGVGLDGSLVQWVDEDSTAWHAGDFAVNQASIGIEHEDGGSYNSPRPDALYARSAQLVAAICSRYGIPVQRGNYAARIAGCIDHRTVYATGCPDSLDTDRIIAQAAGLHGGGGGSIPSPIPITTRRKIVSSPDGLTLICKGVPDGLCLRRFDRDAGTWDAWVNLGGSIRNEEIAISAKGDRVDLFVVNTAGGVSHKGSADGGKTFAPDGVGLFEDLGGNVAPGSLLAIGHVGPLDAPGGSADLSPVLAAIADLKAHSAASDPAVLALVTKIEGALQKA